MEGRVVVALVGFFLVLGDWDWGLGVWGWLRLRGEERGEERGRLLRRSCEEAAKKKGGGVFEWAWGLWDCRCWYVSSTQVEGDFRGAEVQYPESHERTFES